MLRIKFHSYVWILFLLTGLFVVGRYNNVYAQIDIPPPTNIGDKIGDKCGYPLNNLTVECGSGLLCTSNEYNAERTRICLYPVGAVCQNNKQCEGGSFCDIKTAPNGICAITSESEQATTADLRDTIRRAINIVLGFLGIITVILVLYGGFVWLTAAGSEDHVKKGRDILLWAAIGAIVISIAWTISSYILNVAYKVG